MWVVFKVVEHLLVCMFCTAQIRQGLFNILVIASYGSFSLPCFVFKVLEYLPCFVWEDCYDVISMIMQFVTAKKRSVILHVPN